MNRLDMAKKIKTHVPVLAKRDKDEWKHAEVLRREFVSDYPLSKISKLTLDEYVIGKGRDNRSFCYRLEREMDTLGRILGATAFKFGVYYGRTKSDASKRYRFAPHWGSALEKAFVSVKQSIADLLQAAKTGDTEAIEGSRLSRMFKGKLLFVYNPEEFAPIYSREHLEHFIAELDLSGPFNCGADMQRALMEYRATWPQLRDQPPALYMRLLYDVFGYVLRRIVNANQAKVSIDGEAAKQLPMADFLSSTGWEQLGAQGKNAWAGFYRRNGKMLEVHSRPGEADVLIPIGELRLVAECKKGPREKSKNGQERRLLAETIGQAVKWSGGPSDIVFVVVPQTDEFKRVAGDWLRSPLFQSTGVRIALVGGDDSVIVVQTGTAQELDVFLQSIRDKR